MFCDATQFLSFKYVSPYTKPNVVRGLSKHYHMLLDPKLWQVICSIRQITCACFECMSMVDKPWVPGLPTHKQPHYQPVHYFALLPVLWSFNNCNIITFLYKTRTGEAFEEIHQVAIDKICNNMASLVQSGKYFDMNSTDSTTMVYYVIKFVS